ncbi:unnamed protein product [Cylicocyclus nassatus]|uniref:Uncharacterized protein n=1 Tax=Cylicocyclus nassatus TaxID=53992 RepID=A0AA36H6H8_CYLNA|nr:unnamed protein product [Cylicocyclus nassatus]
MSFPITKHALRIKCKNKLSAILGRLPRIRRQQLVAAIIFSFILIYLHKEFPAARSPLKVIVTGGDIDRNLRAKPRNSTGAGTFQLQGQTCLIPKLDINGTEVRGFFFKTEPLTCFKNPRNWVFIDDNGNVQYVKERKNAQCHGYYVTWKSTSDNTYTAFDTLPNGQPMKSDFALVSCTDGWQKWNGILVSVVRRSDENLRNRGSTKSKDGTSLNLYFLGFDSLSQMSFRRKLPKSVKVIEEILEAVVLQGYNIVGDGTPQAFIVKSSISSCVRRTSKFPPDFGK